MPMRDLFPRTSAAYPDVLDWDQSFDWAQPGSRMEALRLVVMQNRFAMEGSAAFLAFCGAVADDVGEMAEPEEIGAEPDTVDEFRFLFATLPMELTLAWGLNGDCYGWVMWSLARRCDRSARVFDVFWSFLPPDSQAAPDYRRLVMQNLPRWTAAFFMLARKFGGLDEVARKIAKLCWNMCEAMLRGGADQEECIAALTSLANWATNANERQAEAWVQYLLGLWPAAIPDRSRAHIGILMMTAAHRFTSRDSRSWAEEMLAEWPHLLTEHLEVQVLAASLRTAPDWVNRRERILGAISALARFYRELAENEASALQALESRVSILHPLIYFLTEHGEVADVLDVLGAWYVQPDGRTCDNDVLVVAAGHRDGVAYLWQGGKLIISRPDGAGTFDRVLEAASLAQREFHRSNAVGDRFPEIDLRRMGQPDERAGPAFEDAVRAHYEPAQLREALPPGFTVRSVITIPATPIPLSAMLSTEVGIAAAEEVSLRQALPDRPFRRLSLWPGSTMHANFEVEALSRVAERAGWHIDIQETADDPAAFEAFYADENADILWVIGHGEHSPYRLTDSGLVIGDKLVTAHQLRRIPIRDDGRRLLVLNVCSGAAAQVRGGIARVGLSQELVTPAQQVVAHLWPIGMYTGLAFGSKFALELASGTASTAYAKTILGMRDPAVLRAELIERLGGDLGIHERLALQDEQIGNVLSWGAPVLLT